MVLLGGLELVAAGILIHKHQKNKKEKERLEDERIALEEEEYNRRRRRSHSRRRRSPSIDRANSGDRAHSQGRLHANYRKHGRDNVKPASQSVGPPPRYDANYPPAVAAPRQDIKYGWRDDERAPVREEQYYPPTGWPAHWEQTRRPENGSSPPVNQPAQPRHKRRESSRGRSETRARQASPYVTPRINIVEPSGREREQERYSRWSPPPSYRSRS